ILAATESLLARHPLGDVRVADIAREAEMTQSNFYSYFDSLEGVLLALGEEITADGVASFVELDWTGGDGFDQAVRTVHAAISLWNEHGAALATIGALADKRYGAFPQVRMRQ